MLTDTVRKLLYDKLLLYTEVENSVPETVKIRTEAKQELMRKEKMFVAKISRCEKETPQLSP